MVFMSGDMSGDVAVKTHSGGVWKGLLRSLLGGESFFLNTFIAKGKGEVWLAPRLPGDISYIELRGDGVIIQDMSYLAHHGDIELSVAWRGFRGLLAEGELFWLRAKGTGGIWVNSFGSTEEVKLGIGEKVIIDNFHFVAMDESMKWRIRKFGGLKSLLFGGEGIVIEVEGPGRVYLQTRSLPYLIEVLRKFFRK